MCVRKTTLAVNLSAALAELGKRVLLVDMDARASGATAPEAADAKIDKFGNRSRVIEVL